MPAARGIFVSKRSGQKKKVNYSFPGGEQETKNAFYAYC